MTCNCKKEIEEKILVNFISQTPEATGHKASLDKGYVLTMNRQTGECRNAACMPLETSAAFLLKNGNWKVRTNKVKMFFNFCPFCGTKYQEQIA